MSVPRYDGPDSAPDAPFYGDSFTATDPTRLDPNRGSLAEEDRWIEENITAKGYVLDTATGEIIDPSTFPGTVVGHLPDFYPRI